MENREIEIKYFVADLGSIEKRLKDAGGRLVQERVLETNLRFDTPDHELSQAYQVLRLRSDTEARLTFKGPSQITGGARIRQEIEFVVEDFEKAKLFLEALGYQVMMTYEKYRTIYHLDEVDITLDELPFGNFIEIEGPSVEQVQRMSGQLGLNADVHVPASYTTLFEQLKNKRGWNFRDLSFENFSQIIVMPADLDVTPADSQ